ncbi:MAG: DNA polymerase III subunit delta' C-terminal domain-containing protein [Bacteroidota bacterium]
MSWDRVIGQERIKKLLQKAVIDNRLAHAYCFIGSDGVGKDAVAIELAKILNCKSPVIEGDSIDSCGECSSCRQAAVLQHTNIQLVFSLPTGKKTDSKKDAPLESLSDEQMDDVIEQIAVKAENPYHKISVQDANTIKIAQVRELRKSLAMAGIQQGKRCLIMSRADEMTAEASNSLLKTLEEPHDNVLLIITTSRQESILPTILSRCQRIKFDPISESDIATAIKKMKYLTDTEARLVAAFAQGSITRAWDFLDEDMKQAREDAVSLLRASLKKNNYRLEFSEMLESIIKGKDKKGIEVFLGILLLWFRDVVSYAKNGSEDFIINSDQTETIKKFAEGYSGKDLTALIDEVEKSISQIRKNVNVQLIMMRQFLNFRKILLT